jgi:hypothetical protein
MATHMRAELPVVFDCNLGEGALGEFEPEAQRDALWQRVESPTPIDTARWEPHVARAANWPWAMVVPVVIAAGIAGAAVSWVGISAKSGALPATPAPPATGHLSTAPPRPSSKPELAAPVTARAPTGPAPAKEPALVPIDPAFERTLASVSQSYRALDAASLTAVWPGADTARLSRAFADLKYQAVSFDHCVVRPTGSATAVASCDALIAAASKAGDEALQRRRESWTLVLDRSGERWTITGASVR